jgi:hypothetical protein
VDAEHRAEGAELEPAREEFRIFGIGGAASKEAACIGIPIRNAAEREVDSSGNLLPENIPVLLTR